MLGSYNIYSGSTKRIFNLLLVPIIILYLVLQILITSKTSGISIRLRRGGRANQHFEENKTSVNFVTRSLNVSLPDDVYLKLTRISVTKNSNNFKSTCSSHVHLLRGFQRKTKGYVTLGLSTVPRDGAFYLPKMLASLMSKITEEDKEDVIIVIFLGSHKKQWINMTLNMIDTKFADSVAAGIIQVVQPEQRIYPDFKTITKRNYNDTLSRVYWRTKQNIDYAHLFAYCDQLSQYYMHVEDDIATANDFMKEIRKFVSKIEKTKETWFLLEFSSLGFIGKLFRSSDLCTMKDYFLLFKDEKPCDLLINNLKNIKTQTKQFKSPKSLFQHFGLSSSLRGKIQKLTDKNFKDASVPKPRSGGIARVPNLKQSANSNINDLLFDYKSTKVPNPEAELKTNMESYGSFSADRPYNVNMNGFFWAKNPNTSDFYRIVFKHPVNITEIQILTGHPTLSIDKLENAVVKVGYISEKNKCKNSRILGSLTEGLFKTILHKPLSLISCLEIFVVKPQSTWVIIYEIIVRTTATEKQDKKNAVKRKKKYNYK